MGYKRVFCSGCGANVELDDSREFGFCRYCGAQIALDKVIVEHRGTVNVNGIADTSALLERAKMHLEVNRYADALQCCDRSLDINPRNTEAYILKLMAETHSTSRDMLGKSIKPLEKYDSYFEMLEDLYAGKINGMFVSSNYTITYSVYNTIIIRKYTFLG